MNKRTIHATCFLLLISNLSNRLRTIVTHTTTAEPARMVRYSFDDIFDTNKINFNEYARTGYIKFSPGNPENIRIQSEVRT